MWARSRVAFQGFLKVFFFGVFGVFVRVFFGFFLGFFLGFFWFFFVIISVTGLLN